MAAGTSGNVPLPEGGSHRFELDKQGFQMDWRSFQIRSGEVNPLRIPRR